MDRVLQLADPILVSVEANPDMLQKLSGSDDIWPFLVQQLSASAWGYILADNIRLVTRSFVATARVERKPSREAVLVLMKFDRTTPQDVTSAFREGYKIEATWAIDEKTGITPADSPSGAAQLWVQLGGDESDKVGGSTWRAKLEPSPDPLPIAKTEIGPVSRNVEAPDGAILPQSEIDKLIAALRDKSDRGEKPTEPRPMEEPQETAMLPQAQAQEMEYEVQCQPTAETPWEAGDLASNTPVGLGAGMGLEEWSETPIPSTTQFEPVEMPQPTLRLRNFLTGQPYIVVVFEHREDFDRELENLRELFPGTLLAFWENNSTFLRLGASLSQSLEEYRTKYRAAAAALESSITHLRQHEQLLPNLNNYRNQQGTLTLEAEKIAYEMHTIWMKQVLEIHEGRFLARKVFAIEATRQLLLRDLTRLSYSTLRRPVPSLLSRSRFARRRLKYLTVQRQLESSFAKLANLEREVQRRLEYQADWQALVSRQLKIQREQEEIGRFIKTAASIPGGPSGDAESLDRWLKSEWDAVRRREKLLRAWQECLTDERAWSIRALNEPVVVLADSLLLSIPGITRGAMVVAMARNHSAIMAEPPEECAEWVRIDPELKTVGHGQGPGFHEDPFLATISDLAKETAHDLPEALQIFGFEERIIQGME